MLNDFRFEYIKARKSHVFILFLSFCCLITILFFGVQSFQQSVLYEEQSIRLNQIADNLKTENQSLRQFNQELADNEIIENAEEDIRFNEEWILFNEHLLPFAQNVARDFEEGDYAAYYESRMRYLEEETRVEEFVDYSHIDIIGEVEEGLNATAQHEYNQLSAFLAADEPMEGEDVSLTAPNHIVLLARFFVNPFILLIVVLLISMVLVEEVSEGSIALQLTETDRPVLWFLSNRLFSVSLFITGLLCSILLSFLLLSLFGRTFFDASPSWMAPIIMDGIVREGYSLLSYFLLNMCVLVVTFIFLHQLFSVLLFYIKQAMISVVVFLTFGLLGFFFTQRYPSLQGWFNPFSPYFLNEWIIGDHVSELYISMGFSLFMSLVLFAFTLRKLVRSPLS